MALTDDRRFYLTSEDDLPYEEDLLKHPFTVNIWLRYLNHKEGASPNVRFVLYERAVKELPGSYKLWKQYLDERRKLVQQLPLNHQQYEAMNHAYERALVFLHTMPRLWLDYCQFLVDQKFVTRARHTLDRALQALPITQHGRIWEVYIKFIRALGIPETAMRVYRRYLKLESDNVEDYVDYLIGAGRLDEAASRLAKAINDDRYDSQCYGIQAIVDAVAAHRKLAPKVFASKKGKTNHQLWMELTDLCAKHAPKITTLKVEPIIRNGIKRFTDQVGKLWVLLADYYIRLGQFEQARNIYEEGMASVMTVRDFTQVFDAYAQFEESLISRRMDQLAKSGQEDDVELELLMARLESLMDRRPFLVNDVLLRQNPNNVLEWQKRVTLHGDDAASVVKTYTRAVTTIDAKKAVGSLPQLWTQFAHFYVDRDDLDSARSVYERAVKADFRMVDELAQVWCDYAEMEITAKNYTRALELMGRATAPLKRRHVDYFDESETTQTRLHKSLKLWSFYADLQESIGTVESAKAVYDRIIELRIATPQIIINYAMFLEENKYFEESFKVYERGVDVFKFPVAFEIWNIYLTKFIQRYGGKKLERARDMFEQALTECPPDLSKPLYLMYAKLEEDYGLAKNAMRIYDRATRAVVPEERLDMYLLYINKVAETYGVTHTREIYERAIEQLPDDGARQMCMRYADLERKLGEIDRARSIYTHGSQLADPRRDWRFWREWHDFEVKHGNEDTFREMLRIKRSVQAQFNTKAEVIAQLLAKAQAPSATMVPASSGPQQINLPFPTLPPPPALPGAAAAAAAAAASAPVATAASSAENASDSSMTATSTASATPMAVQ